MPRAERTEDPSKGRASVAASVFLRKPSSEPVQELHQRKLQEEQPPALPWKLTQSHARPRCCWEASVYECHVPGEDPYGRVETHYMATMVGRPRSVCVVLMDVL